jgi:phage protein U
VASAVFALGDVVFGITGAGLEKIARKRSWRWPETEVVGALRRLSHTGAGGDTVTVGGRVFPGQYGDPDAPKRLAELGNSGEPQTLVDAEGFSYGRWAIVDLDEDYRAILPGGKPRCIDWTMTLKRHPDG